jgi:hypothetical protein
MSERTKVADCNADTRPRSEAQPSEQERGRLSERAVLR